MSWAQLPVELQHEILYLLPETQDFKSCRLVAHDWQKAIDEVSNRIFGDLTLTRNSESPFKRVRALENLIESWRTPRNNITAKTSSSHGVDCRAILKKQRMKARAKFTALLLEKLPQFTSLCQFARAIEDMHDSSDTDLSFQFYLRHRDHPAHTDLMTIVFNYTYDLLNAVSGNNSEAVEYILSAKGHLLDPKRVDYCLGYAAEHGKQDIFFKILSFIQKNNIQFDKEALRNYAVIGGNAEIITSCDSDEKESKIVLTTEAVQWSIRNGLAAFQLIWSKLENPDPTQYSNAHNGSLVHVAASANQVDLLKLLLEMKMPLDQPMQQAQGNLPIHHAAESGAYEACAFLLAQGTAIDSQNVHGSTALIIAAENGKVPLIQLLLEKGANIAHRHNNPYNGHSCSALHEAYLYALRYPEKEDRFEGMKLILEQTSFWDKLRYLRHPTMLESFGFRRIICKSFFFKEAAS